MKLMELFDSKPARIKWATKTKRKWVGHFMADEIPYKIIFSSGVSKASSRFGGWLHPEQAESTWELSFSIDTKGKLPQEIEDKVGDGKEFGITGTGNQGKVFSTVMVALKELIKTEKPYQIQFTAEENSRMKLYKKMVSRFASALGYKPEMTGDYFELIRKD